MVRQKRFELLTARFVAEYSIQLSYWRVSGGYYMHLKTKIKGDLQ